MKTVILCGGEGSRIRDVSEVVPKPMLPIGGRPILWHIMKLYAAQGLTDFILCLGYKGWVIREFFLNYMAMIADFTIHLGHHQKVEFHEDVAEADWRVTLVDTGEKSMTGTRLWRVRRYLEGEDHFCMTYGDGVGDVNLRALIAQHKASGLIATLTGVRVAGRFGELISKDSKVSAFNEKPAATAGRINGGFMVFDNKRIWQYLSDRPDLTLEQEPLARLARDGQLGIYDHDGFWQCMDTLREYNLLNAMWDQANVPWKTW